MRATRILVVLGLLVTLSACAHQPVLSGSETYDAPGFFSGLLHGLLMPFSLVGHLLDSSVRVYAFPNSGGWYDFGYFLGVGGLIGGGASRT